MAPRAIFPRASTLTVMAPFPFVHLSLVLHAFVLFGRDLLHCLLIVSNIKPLVKVVLLGFGILQSSVKYYAKSVNIFNYTMIHTIYYDIVSAC